MRYTLEEEFRLDHPETVGEIDSYFDLVKYKDWLEDQLLEARKQLALYNVSVRDFIVGDVVCTQDGRIWVINEIDGDDLLVDGNGKRNYPLEKCDVSHAH